VTLPIEIYSKKRIAGFDAAEAELRAVLCHKRCGMARSRPWLRPGCHLLRTYDADVK